MLTERQKAKIRKQNQERDKKFVESLNPEEKELRAKYIAARNKADKLYNDFFEDRATEAEFTAAEREMDKSRKAYNDLLLRNRKKVETKADKPLSDSKKAKAAKTKPAVSKMAAKPKPAEPKKAKAPTYTVMGKTFATKAEAQAFKALQKRKTGCEIKESTKKPTHKVVSFTAKK